MKKLAIIISILLLSFSSVYGAIIPGHYILDGSADNVWSADHTLVPVESSSYGEALAGAIRAIFDIPDGNRIVSEADGPLIDMGSYFQQDCHSQYFSTAGTVDTGDGPYAGTGTVDNYFTVSWNATTGYLGIIGDIESFGYSTVSDGMNTYAVVSHYYSTETHFETVAGQLSYNEGTINSGSVDISAVPIPGALWLFGSGLIGVVGIKRKLKK